MTVRYRGHNCSQLRLGVFNPVGRDGSPPTLIRVVPRTERERESQLNNNLAKMVLLTNLLEIYLCVL